MQRAKRENPDFLVLGCGIAGMRAAIELAAHGRVLVLTKGDVFESSTEHAQGGIAAALSEEDEVSLHLQDTLKAGDGLCREAAVRILVEEGPRLIQELIDWGMQFDRDGPKLAFTREGAHSRSRVLHAHGDSTGHGILRALMAKAKTLRAIQVKPFAFVEDLLLDDGAVAGVAYLDERTGTRHEVRARAVLLATGGLGQVYKETTNPSVATGDGVAIAFRAGALASDLEFVQFHPTALFLKNAPRFLLSEALRGEGAQLRNIEVERFMPRYHESAELAPRDVVSRAIFLEMTRHGSEFVYLDLTSLDPEHAKKRFPKIYSTCLKYNIDFTTDLVPVRPAAHYAMGGVVTDLEGATSVARLYAAGEVAATGVHGANRLASNSLLEGLVYGARAARAMTERRSPFAVRSRIPSGPARTVPEAASQTLPAAQVVEAVRTILWNKVGIVRAGKELCAAVSQLQALQLAPSSKPCRGEGEARNILETARLIARMALAREESRGAHYRTDFPLKNESQPPQHSYVAKETPVFFAPDAAGEAVTATGESSH
jgi:L-aspartate oxidase